MEVKPTSALYQLRWVTRVLAVVILALVAIGMLLPSQYYIERSIFINTSPSRMSLYLNDLSVWSRWMHLPNEGVFVTEPAFLLDEKQSLRIKNLDAEDGRLDVLSFGDEEIIFSVIPKKGILPVTNRLGWYREGQGVRVVWSVNGELSAGLIGPYIALFANDIAGSNLEASLDTLKEALQ
ncbi:hypothetical protein O1D97_15840 [Marinomonas sp. 15G1-11]|uniref:Polyketide cyclase n=1 Tax=Marinomonas phaeophyticola TaxID=3004091 RepID=A0ABT4JYA6_9GAMM|nr:hypothetical protein [Marinomonas sp. 15G1-11]MCZ2723047.1 hypothetical protein [Marinomonas sp. 15G1-11]